MTVRTRLDVLMTSAALALAAALLVTPSGAEAQNADVPPNVRLDVHGNFGFYSYFGGGLRVDIPIVRDGFLRANGVKDDLSISPGVELFGAYRRGEDGFGVMPMVMVQWNIYVGNWSFFPEAGIAVIWGPRRWNDRYYSNYVAPSFQLGARWHFSRTNALLLRVGWPAGLQVGITFDL